MDNDQIPPTDHIARHVLKRHILEDSVGVSATAFQLRPTDKYLSCNWLEFYEGDIYLRVTQVITEVKSCRNVKKRDLFGVLNVGDLTKRCTKEDLAIRTVHKPITEPFTSPSHSGIYEISDQPDFLCEVMAEEITELYSPEL